MRPRRVVELAGVSHWGSGRRGEGQASAPNPPAARRAGHNRGIGVDEAGRY